MLAFLFDKKALAGFTTNWTLKKKKNQQTVILSFILCFD